MYLLIAFSLICLSLFEIYTKYRNTVPKMYFYTCFAFILFLFIGLRSCGFDYDNYQYYFNNLKQSDFWVGNASYFGIEKGYALLNYLCSDYRTLLLIMSFLTVGTYSYFIYKKSPYPFLSLFLLLGTFVYPMMMGQYRQALAIGFCIMAILYRKRVLLCLFFMALALLFHVSALIVILALLMPNRILNWKFYSFLLLCALICNFSLKDIFNEYLSLFPSFVENKMEVYVEAEKDMRYGLNLAMLLRLMIFILFWWKRRFFLLYEDGKLYFNIYFLSLIIYLGLGFLPQLGGRGSIYFYFFEVILVPMLICAETNKKYKFAYLLFFIILSVYRQISFFSEWGSDFIPYKYDF